MPSINTNYGAAVALQSLNKTSQQLETTQNRISTGMKVSSAKDNGAIFSIATSQRATAASQDAVRSGLQRTSRSPTWPWPPATPSPPPWKR